MDHARIKNINMRKKNGKEMKNGTVLERELSGFGSGFIETSSGISSRSYLPTLC